ncbi:hypothetical protein I4U23_020932 [Adineta vaga]|nr:hypothetical protein I4U23_020932 [Adineta vaga]
MALSASFAIVWLDSHIGLPTECRQLKSLFQTDLAPVVAGTPVDPIDELICCIQTYCAPISFAANIDDVLQLIRELSFDLKQIILISSGSLGQLILPKLREHGLILHSCYIFCGNMAGNVAWAVEYLEDDLEIQMFDFETSLLVRLSRDLSKELIKQGEGLLNNNPKSALKYFECARSLAETAVARDMPNDRNDPHRPSTTHRQILDGDNGLIARARRACNGTPS